MTIEDNIKMLLQEQFSPSVLEVRNESHLHLGHAGDDGSGQTHFSIMIVSVHFRGKTTVERHRLVYAALKPAFDKGLHALRMRTYSPEDQNSD